MDLLLFEVNVFLEPAAPFRCGFDSPKMGELPKALCECVNPPNRQEAALHGGAIAGNYSSNIVANERQGILDLCYIPLAC